jgi:hypothetical protein
MQVTVSRHVPLVDYENIPKGQHFQPERRSAAAALQGPSITSHFNHQLSLFIAPHRNELDGGRAVEICAEAGYRHSIPMVADTGLFAVRSNFSRQGRGFRSPAPCDSEVSSA